MTGAVEPSRGSGGAAEAGPWVEAFRRLRRNRLAVGGGAMLGAIVLPNGPYGPALEETEPAFEAFRRIGPRSVVQLMLEGAPGAEVSADSRAQIAQLEGGTVFVLPQAPASERVKVLHNVFARLVP